MDESRIAALRPPPLFLVILVLVTGLVPGTLGQVEAQYAHMDTLDRNDEAFVEQQALVRTFYRTDSLGEEAPDLSIYTYVTTETDTLFAVAARLSVPYSAVATLNRMELSDLGDPGRTLLLPGVPGVFVPLEPRTDLEMVMHDLRRDLAARIVTVETAGTSTVFRFYPGEDFTAEERSTFLGLLFRAPLQHYEVSSGYGPREHPVTGIWAFHAGVDLVAPTGTPVMAARSGTVAETGSDPVMGNYVLLEHAGNFTTFYGHLQHIGVSLMDTVRSGMIIGTVGNTGITTGSHLHFEIRQDHDPRDPMTMLP